MAAVVPETDMAAVPAVTRDIRAEQLAQKRAAKSEFNELRAAELADVTLRRGALPRRPTESALLASGQEFLNNTIPFSDARRSETQRMEILDGVLARGDVVDPLGAFDAELKRQGFRDTAPTLEEETHIARHTDIATALANGDTIPSLPNEMDPNLIPEKKGTLTKPSASPAFTP